MRESALLHLLLDQGSNRLREDRLVLKNPAVPLLPNALENINDRAASLTLLLLR